MKDHPRNNVDLPRSIGRPSKSLNFRLRLNAIRSFRFAVCPGVATEKTENKVRVK